MTDEDIRHLFGVIRDDIKFLKDDIKEILGRHDKELEDLKAFKFKVLGMSAVVVVISQIAWKIIEHAIK